MEKLNVLRGLLKRLNGAVIAYSGGVDSTFLAVVAREVLEDRALAVTAVSPTYSRRELNEAKEMAARFGLRHLVIETDEFGDPRFLSNPPDRCYYCKLALFRRLRRLADEEGLEAVLDGSNLDDLADHRPGHRAAREMGVRSPLREAGFTKEEIRHCSKELGLPTWDKPAYACLASRLPYGTRITAEKLARIEEAEEYLRALGFREVRVRDHSPVARLEVGRGEMEEAWRHRAEIAARLHALGYPYVTLDLDGFRSGSMNAVLTAGEGTSS